MTMPRASDKLDFLQLSGTEWQSSYESAAVAIWPLPYERTTSYRKGTAQGPAALVAASHQVELYDEELDAVIATVGICTLDPFRDADLSEEEAIHRIEAGCRELLGAGKFVVGIGGEHTVTVGLVRGYVRQFPGVWVVQIDAHSDLRDSYNGSKLSHACVMARVAEVAPFVGVGIRSTDGSERQGLRPPSKVFYGHDIHADSAWVERVLNSIAGDQVYVTIDLDGLDPAVVPGVGTPEPGGLGWHDLLRFLRALARQKQVVGFDVVELCPRPGECRSEFAAAKLLYKFLGYVLLQRKTA